jgi:hypothetical protein
MRTSLVLALALASCGGPSGRTTTPDEDDDLGVTGSSAGMPEGLDGTRWRWREAHCSEGPLDLTARGYSATVRVREEEDGLTLVTDQEFASENCEHTLLTRAIPSSAQGDWQIEELARVAFPPTTECTGRPEVPRPGEIRLRDGKLEVLVQRSQWCAGLEVRMVYERERPALLTDDEIVRRYALYFTRGDAALAASLFAETGSLLESFTRTETGDPYRHDGRAEVQAWFEETFSSAPWRAMRIMSVEQTSAQGGASQRTVSWEYMDPRLSEPLLGRTRFTIAAGEIFEAVVELASEPQLDEG